MTVLGAGAGGGGGSTTTTTTHAYGEASYWDSRYTQQQQQQQHDPFDWYQNYSSLSPLIHHYFPPSSTLRFLIVGCGNSAFSEGMADDGYENIVNIDISSVVIEAMQKKYINRPQLQFMTKDVRDMNTFQAGSFDAVIDKGTLDSILCGNNSMQNSSMMLKEVGRVLKDNGIYILITYGAPSYRLDLLRNSGKWSIKLHVIEKAATEAPFDQQRWELTKPVPINEEENSIDDVVGKNPDVHYIYVCTKDGSLAQGHVD